MLHGGLGSGAGSKTRFNNITDEFQLIIPDLRGHGKSIDPTGDLSPRQAAAGVFALLDHLKLDRIKAYGGSYGCWILLQMATQQPDCIEAMVLGGAGAQISEQGRDIMRALNRSEMPPRMLQRLRLQIKFTVG